MTIEQVLSRDLAFRYQLLDRLRTDLLYFFNGDRDSRFLWAGDPVEQIKYMKAILKSFTESEKPEWFSLEEILKYEKILESDSV